MLQHQYGAQTTAHYGYVAPQPPPSPPMDESPKCSLPSISNLLGLADQGSPTSETAPREAPKQEGKRQHEAVEGVAVEEQALRWPVQSPASKPSTRPSSSHYLSMPQQTSSVKNNGLPPTPPMGSEASFEGYNSPSTKSVSHVSVASAPNYYYEATPPLEAVPTTTDFQRQHMGSHVPRVPVQPHYQQHFAAPASYMAPSSMGAYYSQMQATPPPQPHVSALYYQRPLPQQFPPMPVPITLTPGASGANPWQHHHYISPSSAAAFPQSQDRYICQTCNKAFSRPSSLRIHSHSHTGEKPFKCPHPGCGKAFSVRSNMKRHERGCHNYDSNVNSGS